MRTGWWRGMEASLLLRGVSALIVAFAVFANKGDRLRVCAQGVNACPVAAVNGYEPVRYTLIPTFLQASANSLGSSGPSYPQINTGVPYSKQTITTSRPLPSVLLRAAGWLESNWRQFTCTGIEDCSGNTLISADCGYGIMQITYCMGGGCGWTPSRVAAEISYNIGTGAVFFIDKWNQTEYIGNNDHTSPEQWYYAVMAYNGIASSNDPNNSSYDPRRPPFGEANYGSFLSPRNYSYQEMVWGYAANPQRASAGSHWLWRPTKSAEMPRGIFGLDEQGGWGPPTSTTRPLVWLLYNIVSNGGSGPSIVLTNTTGQTLAADILLYDRNGAFRTRWLDPSSAPPFYRVPYIRLAAGATRVIPVADALYGAYFEGYLRINASEGVNVSLQAAGAGVSAPGDAPYIIYFPQVFKNYGCIERLSNGGFEELVDGKPRYWSVSSSGGYALADSTWFLSGHYGAYLGGYDDATDLLYQQLALPSGSSQIKFDWYLKTAETAGNPANDILALRVRDASGNLLATLWTASNQNPAEDWQTVTVNLSAYANQAVRVSFEVATNSSLASSFFIDNISLIGCGGL